MHIAAVFPQVVACRSGMPGLGFLAEWQGATSACLAGTRWRTVAPAARMPGTHGCEKNELLRKFKKPSINQCVDSNLHVCDVTGKMLKNSKTDASASLSGGFGTSERKGVG